jgi:GDP/UDP-N,N'-diacetylbacillosamine 2-epimerase (hydrolysing)
MGRRRIKIGILTSSRADYSIYLPLLKALSADKYFDCQLLVFGTHLSKKFGNTIELIEKDEFKIGHRIHTCPENDTPEDIILSMAKTISEFSNIWGKKSFDLLFALGDRYEMFAAVYSTIIYNIPIAHIHGGETTLGSIDNTFRHAITLAAKYHFVSCKDHGERVSRLIESSENIYNIGALSLDNLNSLELYSKDNFNLKYGVDMNLPTVLVTLHPETINPQENEKNVDELVFILKELRKYQILITLPNADLYSNIIRKKFFLLQNEDANRVSCIENLGAVGYFSALRYCSFLIGNTSSGIIEAASFGKWVINLGNRQLGRKQSQNIYNVPFKKESIFQSIIEIEKDFDYKGENIYYKENAARSICLILKAIL